MPEPTPISASTVTAQPQITPDTKVAADRVAPAQPSSTRKSRKSFWLRQFYTIHWMSSAISLIGLLLFAVTGFTLNHAADIEGSPAVSEGSGQLPQKLLPLVAPDDKPDAKKPLPPQVAEWLADTFDVKARGDATSGMVNVFDRSGNAPPVAGQLKEITRMGQRSYNIFPNVTMPIAENLFPAMSLWPLAPDRTRFEIRFLKIPAADGSFDTQVDKDTVAAFGAVAQEDLSVLEDMQSALASGGIGTMPICYGEQFLYNFHRELDRVIGKERVPVDLAVTDIDIPLVGANV